jgi:hypothetical protein
MLSAGFESAIPSIMRLQGKAFDRKVTKLGNILF